MSSLQSQPLPALQLSFEPQTLLSLLSRLSFSTTRDKLVFRLGGLEFFDGFEHAFEFFLALYDFVFELRVDFIAAVDLGLEVADCTVDVADGAFRGGFVFLVFFELVFQLEGKC